MLRVYDEEGADALGLWLEERLGPSVQLVVHSFEGVVAAGEAAACAAEGVASPATAEPGRVF